MTVMEIAACAKESRCCKSFVQSACAAAIVVPPKAAPSRSREEGTHGKHFCEEAGLTPMAGSRHRSIPRMLCSRLGWGLLLSQEWNKAHLINHLAEVHGYRHYLELCTFIERKAL